MFLEAQNFFLIWKNSIQNSPPNPLRPADSLYHHPFIFKQFKQLFFKCKSLKLLRWYWIHHESLPQSDTPIPSWSSTFCVPVDKQHRFGVFWGFFETFCLSCHILEPLHSCTARARSLGMAPRRCWLRRKWASSADCPQNSGMGGCGAWQGSCPWRATTQGRAWPLGARWGRREENTLILVLFLPTWFH